MNSFGNWSPSRQVAMTGLAVMGFSALCALGIGLAVYATRFVPAVVENVGSSAVSLGSLGSVVTSSAFYPAIDVGPVGTALYWFAIIVLSAILLYVAFFIFVPFLRLRVGRFGERVSAALNAPNPAPIAPVPPREVPEPLPAKEEASHEILGNYSSYDGFRSFAHGGALSIEDIVKGLSREHVAHAAKHVAPPIAEALHVEPVYDHADPIIESPEEIVEPIMVHVDIHDFNSALVGGDRVAVFAGLRECVRAGRTPEHLVSSLVCLLDDTFRARIDGSPCDTTTARQTARLDTPTLEKLITALTTAIDSSYGDKVTGAKLALTRALAVLGA